MKCWTVRPRDDGMRSRAFCPGHVTGFFEVHRTDDALSTGSRGAGICLSLGATTEVEVASSEEPSIRINIDGSEREAPVTRRAVELLTGDEPLRVSVVTSLDLPEGQGFGMSAAGALSTSIAVCNVLALDRRRAFEAAHSAEVQLGGGLGDVSALRCGGVAIREKAGLPPIGRVSRIDGSPDIVLAVVGKPLKTADVLSDQRAVSSINMHGAHKLAELLEEPTIDRMMRLSQSFARDTGLASAEVLSAMAAVEPPGIASMSMLGNSVFAIHADDSSVQTLSGLGEVHLCTVDLEGPRLLP